MTEGRSELRCVSLRGVPWLVKVYDTRPHAERERKVDYLCSLFSNELELTGGRFHSHTDAWLDHCVEVDFSAIEEHGEQVLQFELMLEWIAREGGTWSLAAPVQHDLIIEFWFADLYRANVFELRYGGRPAKIERA